MAQAQELEQAWQAIDSLGLTDQLQLWAYHDDLLVRIVTAHFTTIFEELRKAFDDHGLHVNIIKTNVIIPLPDDTHCLAHEQCRGRA